MEEIIKRVKSLEDSGILLKGVSEAIQNKAKEQKEVFRSMLLGTLGVGNMLTGKGINRNGKKLIPPHPLTNFEIRRYYHDERRFNGVYSRDNLPDRIKDGAYVRSLNEYSDIATHWITLYALSNNVTYFDIFGVEHIPK